MTQANAGFAEPVLVTGAAGGIGAAVVEVLLARGYRVHATDVRGAHLRALGHLEMGERSELCLEELDICQPQQVQNYIGKRPWSGMVHCAGWWAGGSALTSSDEDWRRLWAVNLDGLRNLCRAMGPQLVGRGHGSIVTIASNAARIPRIDMAEYAAVKAAVVMYTKSLGLELAEAGVRCNLVSPGSTNTPMQAQYRKRQSRPADVRYGDPRSFRTGIPLAKIAEPREIAEVAEFLLSERASHITMADFCVDGGATLGVGG